MLSPEELQARIAAEFLRVGASQQSWDQNFPSLPPSVWVPDPITNLPTLSEESRQQYETIGGPFLPPVVAATPPPNMNCPEPSVQTFYGSSWVCMMPDGSLVVSEDEESDEVGTLPIFRGTEPAPVVRAPTTVNAGPLPVFIGGRMGRVLFPQIANRQLTGVRTGTLPQVVFGDEAPASYGTIWGLSAAAGAGSENIEP